MAAKNAAEKSLSAAELRALSVEELRSKLAERRKESLDMRFRHATAQLEKTSELKSTRRQVARIMTVLQEKK